MFNILPDECLLIIIGLIVGEKDNTKYSYYFGWDWKKKMTPKQIRDGRLVKWKRPAFIRILPLMMVSKEINHIFNTNNIWTYLYEQEFRKGTTYKRKPKDSRMMMLDKSKGIIKKRYDPILVAEKEKVQIGIEAVKRTMKQIYTIDAALSNIKPQIRNGAYFDDDEKMDRLTVILSPVVHLPEGYVNSWGHIVSYPTRQTLKSIARERACHRNNGEMWIRKKRASKEKIIEIEKIMERL
jgi:hypothetical protein